LKFLIEINIFLQKKKHEGIEFLCLADDRIITLIKITFN